MPLKKEFRREDVMIVEITKHRNAANRYAGLAFATAVCNAPRSTFVNTRYRDKLLIPNFKMSLVMLQSLFFSIKNPSNLVSFPVSSFEIGAYVNFG